MKTRSSLTTLALISALVLSQTNVGFSQQNRRVLIGFKGPNRGQAANERANAVRNAGGAVHHTFHTIPVISAELPEPAVAQLERRVDVEYVEDDIELYAIGQTIPWGMTRIGAPAAWSTATGQDRDVAVLDTGIDYDHLDLSTNIAGGVNWVGTNPRKDGSTIPGDWDDGNGHGTHCAGTIAAVNNDIGVVGVAPQARLWGVKVLSNSGTGWTSDIAQGIEWCIDQGPGGIEVISMSIGGGYSLTLQSACNAAYSANILLVAAAGNEGGAVSYPAAYASVVAVSAVDSTDALASWSNRGPQIELAAPGVGVLSTVPGGYATYSGTSMACPHVAGTAALAWTGSNEGTRTLLWNTAENIDLPPDQQGHGLVDAKAAVGGGGTLPPPNSPPTASFSWIATDLTVALDASASADSDGLIEGYAWDFGDDSTGTGKTLSHTYKQAGTYLVTLTVTDDDGATGTAYASVPVTSGTGDATMHVESIVMSLSTRKAGKNKFTHAEATVTIVDADGIQVGGATVYGSWSVATSDADYGVTNASGEVAISSDEVKNPSSGTTFTFTVTDVVKSDVEYVSADNLVTSGSTTVK